MLELPKRPYQRLSPPHWPAATDHAWRDGLRTGHWKDKSRFLESVIAKKLSVPPEWVLATSSCTAALGVAFYTLWTQMPEWTAEEPALPRLRVCPLTYPATYCWALNFGWEIEWVDCDNRGWPVSEVDVGVDLWGRRFPGNCVVLDAAHRVFDPRHAEGLRSGQFYAVAYSFGPQKEVPCLLGGAIICPALGERDRRAAAESLIHSGQGAPLGGGFKGYLPFPAAKAISKQISIHAQMKARRQKVLKEYAEWFGDDLLTQPDEASGHLAVVKLRTPGHKIAATRRLSKLHVDHSLHYPIPDVPCPNAKELVSALISLPCHTEMRRHDVLLVARAVLTSV